MASLAKNILWNSIRVASNILFPLVTFPYIARVLGPEGKGEFDYVYAIVQYFILFANLGFPLYGIREISKNRENRQDLSSAVSGIFTANIISASICGVAFLLFCQTVVPEERMLYYVLGISILFSCIQFDWFYQGVEDFKYITIRSLIIKFLSVIALFIFVHSKNDLVAYAIISVIGVFGNNIFNLFHLRKFADLRFSLSNCWYHTRGASTLFLGSIAVSFYTQLNTVMLGALGSNEAVGYFTAGNKMVHLILSVIVAVLSTIIPRISYQLGTGKVEEGKMLQKKVFNLTLYVSYPITVGLIFLAGDVVMLLAGDQYGPSIPALQVLSCLIVAIPISQFLGLQVLYPVRKEKYGNYATISGAVTNLLLNYYLISTYSYMGVAVAVVLSESVVTIVHYYYARHYMTISLYDFLPRNCVIALVVMGLFLLFANYAYSQYGIIPLLVKGCLAAVLYVGLLYVMKDHLCMTLMHSLAQSKKHR